MQSWQQNGLSDGWLDRRSHTILHELRSEHVSVMLGLAGKAISSWRGGPKSAVLIENHVLHIRLQCDGCSACVLYLCHDCCGSCCTTWCWVHT